MSIFAPKATFVPRTITLGLSHPDRRAIETQIEELIALLDQFDGDPDLEEDDPSGDPLDVDGEHPTEDGRELLPTLPVYGTDQTTGPVNEREALRERHRLMMQEGYR